MTANFISKYQTWISLAGLNDIGVKLYILLTPQIPFSSAK